ncbi:SOS response associated peptidase (SRAP) domain-containing protein [Phthorimaea operculella]|nr:SOS response associated peptidase (SRAP) domain-containing protein [Phthorimaea operculella]
MCGRTALSLDKEQLRCACSYKATGEKKFRKPDWVDEHNDGKQYTPSNNIAPTDVTPVLISSIGAAGELRRVLKPMMWGIVPPWHKGHYKSHNLSTNNCRLESVKSSKLYGPILRNGGRCVIVVEGFYEWKTTDKSAKVKQPYYIYMPQEGEIQVDNPSTWKNNFNESIGWTGIKLMHMAGLYQVWQDGNVVICAYSVITMESNSSFNWLHHRVPAILDTQEKIDMWLDCEKVDADMATSFLKPDVIMSWHPVSTLVNNSRNKSADCNKKQLEQKNKASQKTLTNWLVRTMQAEPPECLKNKVVPCYRGHVTPSVSVAVHDHIVGGRYTTKSAACYIQYAVEKL